MTVVSTAYGQDRGGAGEQDGETKAERAQKFFERGRKAYENEEYEDALESLGRAASLQSHPVVWYNMALASAKLGDHGKALKYSRKASVEDGLKGKTRVSNLGLRQAAGTILNARLRAEAISDAEGDDLNEPVSTSDSESEPEPTETPTDGEETGFGKSLGAVGWIGGGTAAAGVGLTSAALIINASLKRRIENLDNLSSREAYQLQKTRISNQQAVGRFLLYTGVGLAATGGALLIVELTNAGEGQPVGRSLFPGISIGPGKAKIELVWRF